MNTEIKDIIARQLTLAVKAVENTLLLFDEGCTIPFISGACTFFRGKHTA